MITRFRACVALSLCLLGNSPCIHAHSFVSLGTIERPAEIPAGGFGAAFVMHSGQLAAWQARDGGRVSLFDTSAPNVPVHLSTLTSPDSVFDNPSFGTKLALLGSDLLFIGSPYTWLSGPHDGRVYAYDVSTAGSPAFQYKFAESPHSAGYFGSDLCVAGDVLVATQGSNAGSWQTRSGIFFYRINGDGTLTLIGQRIRTSDFMNPTGCAISGDVCAAAFQVLSDVAAEGECLLFRIERTDGVPTGVSVPVALPLADSSSDPTRAPSGWFFRLAFKDGLLAVANFGVGAVANDNDVAIYRVDDQAVPLTVSQVGSIPVGPSGSAMFGRRLAFAWDRLFVSDPEAPRTDTTAKGVVHIYSIGADDSITAEGLLESQTNVATESFGEFLAFDDTIGSGGVLAVGCRQDLANLYSDNVIQLFSALPEIVVTEEGGAEWQSGAGLKELGHQAVGSMSDAITLLIQNAGLGPLEDIAVATAGLNALDFSVAPAMIDPITAGQQASVTVRFSPQSGVSGQRFGTVRIASTDADENPFDLNVAGWAYSTTLDHDSDGMNDWAEFNLAPLGFDWETNNQSLVDTLMQHASLAGFFTRSQVQDMNVGTPLLERDPNSGKFRLTLGLTKSVDMGAFNPMPINPAETSVNGDGKIEVEFSVPDNAAFFRMSAE